MSELSSAIFLSLRIAACATVVAAAIGVPLAFALARRRFPGKSLVEALLTIPLVLPPTVVGYALIILLGRSSPMGQFIESAFGSGILFTVTGAVIASAVVSLPLLYLPVKAAFATVEPELEEIARLMGANPLQVFWHVSLPTARRGIASGVLLAFARSIGEFGATLMVFGSRENQKTLPILVYDLAYETGSNTQALPAILILIAISLLAIFLCNRAILQSDS